MTLSDYIQQFTDPLYDTIHVVGEETRESPPHKPMESKEEQAMYIELS